MKLGVMSDTHGHLDALRQAVSRMIEEHGVEAIIHLGDDSTDLSALELRSVELLFVPGVFEPRYKDLSVENRIIRDFEDIPFLITHTPTRDPHDLDSDIDPTEAVTDGDVKVMLHGHTHKWRITEEKGVIVVNPGHLIPEGSKGSGPTFAVIDVAPGRVDARIISLDGERLAEKTFFF